MQVLGYKGTLKTLSHQCFKCFFIFQSNNLFMQDRLNLDTTKLSMPLVRTN